MKKFFIVSLAVLFCLGFTTAAMAKITMSGMITADFYYDDLDNNFVKGGNPAGVANVFDDVNITEFSLPAPLNRFGMHYANDDNTIRGFIELRGGGRQRGSALVWNYAYIDWQLNPNVYLRLGRQTQAFSIQAPQNLIGFNAAMTPVQILLIGFGNPHGGTTFDAARLYWKFNDNIRLELQLIDPDSDLGAGELLLPRPAPPLAPAIAAWEENTLPRFDFALPITFGSWRIEPSGTYLSQNYDQVRGGCDDSEDIWAVGVYIGTGIGPWIFEGEFTYGENLGDGGYIVGGPGAPVPGARVYRNVNDPTILQVSNTEMFMMWVQAGFKFGPATLFAYYGRQEMENDGNPSLPNAADPLEFDVTRQAYGLSLPIAVGKGFTIRPEFTIYDFDDGAEIGGINVPVDLGREIRMGVQAMLVF